VVRLRLHGDPAGWCGGTWLCPGTDFPSWTASLKSPRPRGAIPKEDTASQEMLHAGRRHLPEHSCICTEDDIGPPASALSRWHPSVTDPRGAAPWWPYAKASTNFFPSWGMTRFHMVLDIIIPSCLAQATERMQRLPAPLRKQASRLCSRLPHAPHPLLAPSPAQMS